MEELVDIAVDVLLDAGKDTLYLVPFLFATYLFMEWLEHKTGKRTQAAIARAGKAGPLVGAVLGVVPQCGFSAAASTLYAGRVIGLGTLFAVYLSTSDEMLPIFIAEQVPPGTIIGILVTKVVIGIAFGLLVDLALRIARRPADPLRIHELCERDRCDCAGECATCKEKPELAYEHHDDRLDEGGSPHHAHDHTHDEGWGGIAKSALKHTVQVALFVFLVSLALNIVIELVGEDALAAAIGSNSYAAVVASAIVGLIPNCAASVAIAQLYVEGVLGFGACIAGLLSAAGVGLLVLLRTNRRPRENAIIILTLVLFSSFCGIVFQFAGFAL